MNSYLLRNLSGITSASIEKYLLFTGWVRDDTFNSMRIRFWGAFRRACASICSINMKPNVGKSRSVIRS